MGAFLPASALVAALASVVAVGDESTALPQHLQVTASSLEALSLATLKSFEPAGARTAQGSGHPANTRVPT